MTQCFWVDPSEITTKQLPANGKIFVGDEGCGKFLSDEIFNDKFLTLIDNNNDIGLIAPFLTTKTELAFAALLAKINTPIDVIVNDFGALRLVQKSRHHAIIGRVMTRQSTDPAIFGFTQDQPEIVVFVNGVSAVLKHKPPPESLMKHFRSSPVFSIPHLGETQVMLDLPPHGLPETVPENFTVMVNTKNVLIAMLPCDDCVNCPQSETLIGKTRSDVPIYRKRNTCYYKNKCLNEFELSGYELLVDETRELN